MWSIWLHIENYFFELLFIASIITVIHNVLPKRTLPLCLTVKLKSLCSAHREILWPCPTVNQFSQSSYSAMSNSLQLHGLKHNRLPSPLPSPGVCSNSCPLSQWCHPTISSSVFPFSSHLQSFPGSAFSNESASHIRWPKYWSFSFNISPSNEYSGLISFRMDWFDLLAVQGTLRSLLHHHSSKASILRCSAFFMVQLSHLYMTTGKTIALTRWTLVGKVMSLLFNMLSRLIKMLIAFVPRSRHLLISWLLPPSAVILEPQKIKSPTVSIVFPSICHEVPPVNSYNKKKRLTHPFQRLALPDVLQDWRPFRFTCPTASPFLLTLLPQCLSLSILPLDISSSLLLSLWLYKRCWHPDPLLGFTLRPSSRS